MAVGDPALVRGRSAVLGTAEAGAAGIDLLAGLWWQGVRRLVVVPRTGEPPARSVTSEDDLAEAVARFNRLIASRGLTGAMRIGRADRTERAVWEAVRADERAENPGRRRFLRALSVPAPATDGEAGSSRPPSEPALPLARLQRLGADRPDALYAHVVRIDPESCDGCDACVAICPEEVLTLVNVENGESAYRSDPALCTGCYRCVEICDRGAVNLGGLQRRPHPVRLVNFTCTGCGVPVHEPMATAGPADLCRICRQTGHHAKLYQVLT